MGMFDTIICRWPLPGTPPAFIKPDHSFQTKSLNCLLDQYEITSDGRLTYKGEPVEFHGEIQFYTSNISGGSSFGVYTRDGEDAESVEYLARFSCGQLMEITLVEHTREPALPISKMRAAQYQNPSPKEIAEDQRRRNEKLKSRVMWVAWGGKPASEGYAGVVVAENGKEWVVQQSPPDGKFEIIDRRLRDSILFDSLAAAECRDAERKAERDKEKAEYEAMLKERT
jgi:hypothetical protein